MLYKGLTTCNNPRCAKHTPGPQYGLQFPCVDATNEGSPRWCASPLPVTPPDQTNPRCGSHTPGLVHGFQLQCVSGENRRASRGRAPRPPLLKLPVTHPNVLGHSPVPFRVAATCRMSPAIRFLSFMPLLITTAKWHRQSRSDATALGCEGLQLRVSTQGDT